MIWNGAQFHMLVNHLPVIGFIGVVPAIAFGMISKSLDIKRFVLVTTTIVGLSALAPFWTGEPAEETLERLPGFDKELIHEHEEAAEFATILAVVTGIAAGCALILQRKRPESTRKTLPAVLVLSLITGAAMAKTAHEGGKIGHPEIRDRATGATSGAPERDSDD